MHENKRRDIRTLTLEELKEFFISHGDKSYRAKQVWEWLWVKSARSFKEMTNISYSIRLFLNDNFDFSVAQPFSVQISKDKTVKTAFRLRDNLFIESVLIPAENRITACISSQVGCSLACKFCATGKIGFQRNLSFDEIFDQITFLSKQAQERYALNLSNIVFMGMGEPLLNYENVLKAIEKITSQDGLGMSPSRITISTVGLAKMIKQLGDADIKVNLALSLHAANDKKRSEIIPVNEQNSLKKLTEALKYYYSKTNERITLEYLIFDRFNDTINDAKELADFCKNVPCKVNIIEYNHVENTGFKKTTELKVKAFTSFLETKNIIVNIRKSRGEDISAACGQLVGKKDDNSII